jgi:hypothetical protein
MFLSLVLRTKGPFYQVTGSVASFLAERQSRRAGVEQRSEAVEQLRARRQPKKQRPALSNYRAVQDRILHKCTHYATLPSQLREHVV